MSVWGGAAATYGVLMLCSAATRRVPRCGAAAVAAAVFSIFSAVAGTARESLWVNLLAPGALLLTGYWLSGLLFDTPQPWLEGWLMRVDHALGAPRWIRGLPCTAATTLEAAYTSVHLLVGGGAVLAATAGVSAVTDYWNLVLTCELASFAPLPWLRSRPPRALEGQPASRAMRRFNVALLDRASVQANTLPSGHVSGAVAAGLALLATHPAIGALGLVLAAAIAVAAIVGRYHYAVDCAAGAALSLLLWSLL